MRAKTSRGSTIHGEQSSDPAIPLIVLRLFTGRTQSFHLSPQTSLAWTTALVSRLLGSELMRTIQSAGFTSLPEQGTAARHLKEISDHQINQADHFVAAVAASSAWLRNSLMSQCLNPDRSRPYRETRTSKIVRRRQRQQTNTTMNLARGAVLDQFSHKKHLPRRFTPCRPYRLKVRTTATHNTWNLYSKTIHDLGI